MVYSTFLQYIRPKICTYLVRFQYFYEALRTSKHKKIVVDVNLFEEARLSFGNIEIGKHW